MRLRLYSGVLALVMVCCVVPAVAAVSGEIRQAVRAVYAPAVAHRGLETAQDPVDPNKIRTFVVLAQGGIAAAKAEWYVQNQDYDFRPVVMDLATGGVKTRRGKVYTYLERGQVMLLVDTLFSGNTVYFKLLSADVYTPPVRPEPHPSRVGTLLGLKFPRRMLRGADPRTVLDQIESWLRPFSDRTAADVFATALKASPAATPATP